MVENLSGKKEEIFDTAISLFARQGYENTSMREIGQEVGIKAASLYNHFESKNIILECVYQYYQEHFLDNIIPLEECRETIKSGTRSELLHCLVGYLDEPDEKRRQRMRLITKIIYMRLFIDEKAKKLFVEEMLEQMTESLSEKMQYAVSIERLEKAADIKTIAKTILYARTMACIVGFIDGMDILDTTLEQLLPLRY